MSGGTFVSVGNAQQPFSRLLQWVAEAYDALPGPVTVQRGHTPFADPRMHVVDFMNLTDFTRGIGAARLVVIHAGAGSIVHAVQAGHRPIVACRLVRYGEHVDNHQVALARVLEEAGRVVVAHSAASLAVAVASAGRRAANGPFVVPPAVNHLRRLLEPLRDQPG